MPRRVVVVVVGSSLLIGACVALADSALALISLPLAALLTVVVIGVSGGAMRAFVPAFFGAAAVLAYEGTLAASQTPCPRSGVVVSAGQSSNCSSGGLPAWVFFGLAAVCVLTGIMLLAQDRGVALLRR